MSNFLIIALISIFGASLGSFLSVLVNRLINEETGILFGHSKCPNCQHRLQVWNLIPIFSYLFQRGLCQFCQQKIKSEYFWLEVAGFFCFSTINLAYLLKISDPQTAWLNLSPILQINFWQDSSFWQLFLVNPLAFLSLNLIVFQLFALIYSDLKYKAIPTVLLVSSAATFLLSSIFINFQIPFQTFNWLSSSGGALLPLILFGSQILLSKGKWLGSGDFWFALPVGFFLGFEATVSWLFITYLIGGLFGVFVLLFKQQKNLTIAFLPLLGLPIIPCLLIGRSIFDWYFNLPL